MKKILFMLQNGIGFGHFKIALNIANYLNDKCEISFITQAKSTEIFNNYNYKIYNFPLLYTLKSNNEILIINRIMNSLIERINPDLVIEDTYPEDFYLNLPSLMNIPKVLLLNRLSSFEFENFYFNGILNQYDKLIVLKDKECFINEITSLEVKNYVKYSDRIKYLSGIFSVPTKEVKKSVAKKYNLKDFEKNIVVSCGAGGWHIGTNVCEEIFRKVINITKSINSDGKKVQAILVLGPYSKYLKNYFANEINTNYITIVDFETNLDALFHLVDLCILRPGYNSTMEAISGNANILLLPGISYMEDQESWCKELSESYGVNYVNVNDLNSLDNVVRELLNKNNRIKIPISNNTKNVATEIYSVIEKPVKDKKMRLALNIQNFNLCESCVNLLKSKNIDVVQKVNGNFYLHGIPIINKSDYNSNDYKKNDELILYNDKRFCHERLPYYDKRYHIEDDGHLVVEYYEVTFENIDSLFKEINQILNNNQKFKNNIVINFNHQQAVVCNEIIRRLLVYLKTNNIIIENLDLYLGNVVNSKISNYKYEFYRPEITKLT